MKKTLAAGFVLAVLFGVLAVLFGSPASAATPDTAQVCVGVHDDCTSDVGLQADVAGKEVDVTVGLKGEPDETNVTYTITYDSSSFSTTDVVVNAPMTVSGTGGTDFKNLPVTFVADAGITPGVYSFGVTFNSTGDTPEVLATATSSLTVTSPPTTTVTTPPTTVVNNVPGATKTVTTVQQVKAPVGAPETGGGSTAHLQDAWLLFVILGIAVAILGGSVLYARSYYKRSEE